jgi:hypothetical protein
MNVMASANVGKQVVPSANVSVELEEEYDVV